jgi:hypothetical protein
MYARAAVSYAAFIIRPSSEKLNTAPLFLQFFYRETGAVGRWGELSFVMGHKREPELSRVGPEGRGGGSVAVDQRFVQVIEEVGLGFLLEFDLLTQAYSTGIREWF